MSRASFLPAEPSLQPITDREFNLFQGLIYREAGIYLSPAKKALLVGRLSRRLRALGLSSFGDYYRHVIEGNDGEQVRMLDSICTNETHFFREPKQFEFLEQSVFPEWVAQARSGSRAQRIRVWSAACSTGEEPYSLAMSLLANFPAGSGWEIEILATDLSTRALMRSKEALWPIEKAEEIPQRYLKLFMLRGVDSQKGRMKAGPEIRRAVQFQRLNLNDDAYPAVGQFDLIFCRNVLIYFDAQSKARVINRLLNHLTEAGYLFLGHAESLTGMTDRVQSVMPSVYTTKKPGGGK